MEGSNCRFELELHLGDATTPPIEGVNFRTWATSSRPTRNDSPVLALAIIEEFIHELSAPFAVMHQDILQLHQLRADAAGLGSRSNRGRFERTPAEKRKSRLVHAFLF